MISAGMSVLRLRISPEPLYSLVSLIVVESSLHAASKIVALISKILAVLGLGVEVFIGKMDCLFCFGCLVNPINWGFRFERMACIAG